MAVARVRAQATGRRIGRGYSGPEFDGVMEEMNRLFGDDFYLGFVGTLSDDPKAVAARLREVLAEREAAEVEG